MKIKSILVLLLLTIAAVSCKKKDNTPEPAPAPTPSPLPTISTSTVKFITAQSATSGGTVSAEGTSAVTAVGVCWDTNPSPTTLRPHTNDGAGIGTYTSTISGLNPNTTYYVRAYATNASGTAYGTEYSFTTTDMWTLITPAGISIGYEVLHTKGTRLFGAKSWNLDVSLDHGITWLPSTTGLSGAYVNCLEDDGINLFCGTNQGFYSSTDDGANWVAKNNGLMGNQVNLIRTGTMGIFVVANNYEIYRSTDLGNNWVAAAPIGTLNTGISSLVIKGNKIFAAKQSFGLFSSTDNGMTWTPCTNGLTGIHVGVVVSGNNILASSETGNFISSDNGLSWTLIGGGLPAEWAGFAAHGNNVLAVQDNGLYLSVDNGMTWIKYDEGIPGGSFVYNMHIDSDFTYVIGNDYKLYRRNL